MARKPLLWLAACCAVGLGFARGAVGQDEYGPAIHGLTVTGCMEQTPRPESAFLLTHAVTVTPDNDRRTGFSSPKTSTPAPMQVISNIPDQYRLTVDPEKAGRFLGHRVSAIGTFEGSQLRVHHIRTLSLTCS